MIDVLTSTTQANAKLCFSELSKVPGLRPVMPRGAMYLLVELKVDEFPDIPDDRVFTEMLMSEESVFCLPAVVSEPSLMVVAPVELTCCRCSKHQTFSAS